MNFILIESDKAFGTSYQGIISIKYPELCAIFGQPEIIQDGKVQVQWVLLIAGAVVATIYDYKETQEPRTLLQWHIGGSTKDVVQLINIIIKEYRKENK